MCLKAALELLSERCRRAGATRFIILSFIWWKYYEGIGFLSPRKYLGSSFLPHRPASCCCFISVLVHGYIWTRGPHPVKNLDGYSSNQKYQ